MVSDSLEISQRIFKSGEPIEISVRARYFQQDFAEFRSRPGELKVEWIHDDNCSMDHGDIGYYDTAELLPSEEPSVLRFRLPPLEEGPVRCYVNYYDTPEHCNFICGFSIYVLDEDLFVLRPYRGDMHVHTSFSQCGSRDEHPAFTLAVGRQKGLDFMAITDHIQIEGSEAAEGLPERLGSEMKFFKGEECHLLHEHRDSRFCKNWFRGWIHIVNFGGSDGVSRYANDHFEEYLADLKARAAAIGPNLPENLAMAMAYADWACDKIHELGGIAIFCHPFWHQGNKLALPAKVRDYIFAQGKFDVLEIPGEGSLDKPEPDEDNNLAYAWWHELCVKAGRNIPVVGNTDSHHARALLGVNYTIVFARDDDFASLADSLRKGLCVSVGNDCRRNHPPLVMGAFRLVRYAQFLLQDFYPEHNEMLSIEGSMMLANLRGEDVTPQQISAVSKGRLAKLFKKYFG